jgi:hypothetical protein
MFTENQQVNIPKMMTIPQLAKTGILPCHALRILVKQGVIPSVKSGKTTYVNYDVLVNYLNRVSNVA